MTKRDRNQTSIAVRFFRATLLLFHLFAGIATVALLFPFYGSVRRRQAVARWSARILSAVNVEPRLRGVPPAVKDRAAVMVANHISWLDIPLVHSVWQVRFIAKSEVRRWPLIGWLSARTGTLFIQRGKSRHAARINQVIHAALLDGDAIGVFPEGTTSEGTGLQPFHASLLQPAVDERALVFPVALRYLDEDGRLNVNASYVGDTSLLESMAMILRERKIVAEMIFLPAIDAEGKLRRDLARETHAAIAAALSRQFSDK
ncbi:MAG TPA: lysophospholipid acyltransferase family protein [Burkholderiales bacterium]|nr:lysophospholipid acyltransferase family protein [Burkholderiales bacterium]